MWEEADISDKVLAKGIEGVSTSCHCLFTNKEPCNAVVCLRGASRQKAPAPPPGASALLSSEARVVCSVVLVFCGRPQFSLTYHIHSCFCSFFFFFFFLAFVPRLFGLSGTNEGTYVRQGRNGALFLTLREKWRMGVCTSCLLFTCQQFTFYI